MGRGQTRRARSQLVTIGDSLAAQGPLYGITAEDIAVWQKGAAVNSYLPLQLIPAMRDFSTGVTAARDELQLDKTVENFVVPVFNPPAMSPLVQSAVDAPVPTDFLDWCDKLFQKMRANGLTAASAKRLGFLVSEGAPSVNPADLQPRIKSMHAEGGGKMLVDVERNSQPMIRCKLVIDTGETLKKTLPNSRFSFAVPTDRVHQVTATAIYADKNGDFYGKWSDPKSETSEL